MDIVMMPIGDITPYPDNPRTIGDDAVNATAASIREFDWQQPIVVGSDMVIIAGHTRRLAAMQLGMDEVPVYVSALTAEQAMRYRLADNKTGELADWDMGKLLGEIRAIEQLAVAETGEGELEKIGSETMLPGFNDADLIALDRWEAARGMDTGADPDGEDGSADPTESAAKNGAKRWDGPDSRLTDTFVEPPVSVLNTATGRWRERKKAWVAALPIDYDGAMGRPTKTYTSDPGRRDMAFYSKKHAVERALGRQITTKEFVEHYYSSPTGRLSLGTSQFDPVLCELVSTWFCHEGGLICDPFAGGAERGLVASAKGRRYSGIDVRKEQCEANADAAARMGAEPVPEWVEGTSVDAGNIWGRESADLIFTCPPYWNLEKYSNDPRDLSNMDLESFTRTHEAIISACAGVLKPNRFAVWVVGDVRDKKAGRFIDLQGRTKRAFQRAGMSLHAEMILVTPIGSRAIAARRMMQGSRNITLRHEHVLLFCKGSAKAAATELGPVEVGEVPPEGDFGPEDGDNATEAAPAAAVPADDATPAAAPADGGIVAPHVGEDVSDAAEVH